MPKTNNITNNLIKEGLVFGHRALSTQHLKRKKVFFVKALNAYQKAIKLDPKNRRAIQGIARTYLHQKQFFKSLNFYKKGLSASPKIYRHIFLNGIGNVYRYLGDWNKDRILYYKKSIDYYKKALKANTNTEISALYWSNLSRSYANMQNWKDAIKTNEKTLKILKKEKVNHGNLSKILTLENKLYKEYLKRTLL